MSDPSTNTELFQTNDSGFDICCFSSNSIDVEIIITENNNNNKIKKVENEKFNSLLQPVPPEKLFRQAQKAYYERLLEFKVAAGYITQQTAALFQALAKTMPVSWQGNDTIVVMDEVLVDQPYTKAKLMINSDNVDLLNRVQKLVDYEKSKIK